MTGAMFAIAATLLAAQAQPASPLKEEQEARLIADCNLSDAVVIDAREVGSVERLALLVAPVTRLRIVLFGAELEQADMSALVSSLNGGCVIDSALKGSNWRSLEVPELTFVRSDLSGANFGGATIPRAHFIGTSLAGADLSDADISGGAYTGNFWTSDLSEADLSGANLTRFVFRCGITMDEACNTFGADFSRANLTQADLSEFPSWGGSGFEQAVIDRTRLHPRAVASFEGLHVIGEVVLSASAVDDGRTRPSATLAPSEFATLRGYALQAATDQPSFDCDAAESSIEQLICAPYESHLRSLDRDMTVLWSQVRAMGKGSLAEQRGWLRSRDKCKDRGCLADSYEARMSALFVERGAEFVLAPDATLEFDADVLPVPDAARRGDLYTRLVPVLKSASRQSVRLTALEDGRIRATGDAIGGNAHMCSLGVDARYDAATGWYGADGDSGDFVPLFRVWDNRLFFRYSGNLGDTPIEVVDYISCGARAGFSTLRDLSGALDN